MKLKLSDSVSFRLIQIFQEAMILGVDGADLFRQVRLVMGESDDVEGTLELSPEYVQQVKNMHAKLLADAERLQSESSEGGKLIVQ